MASSDDKHDVARGGFGFGGAVFAYGLDHGKPTLWTPELDGKSTKLERARFSACTDAFDGNATPVLDPPATTSATIGRAGGSVSAGAVTLTVPPGALSEDTRITMTPITDLSGSPLEGTLIAGARLEPDGLRFLAPALLTMPLPAAASAADVLGFGSASDGSDLHLVPHSLAGGTVTIEVWHFSTGGASAGGAAAVTAMVGYQPTAAESAAQQRIAAASQPCQVELIQGIVNGPACTFLRQEQIRALFAWYTSTVKPQLDHAVGAPSFDVEHAMAEWVQWQATVEAALNDLTGPCGPLGNECSAAKTAATAAVQDLALRRLQNCTGTALAGQLRDISRVADFVDGGGIDLTANGSGLPDVNELPHACAHLKIDVTDFPAVAALLHGNTLRGRVTVDVFTGPDRTDVPFTLTVGGAPVSTTTAGNFDTTVTTTTAPLNVVLEAVATDALLQNNNFTARVSLTRPARDRIELDALNPTTIHPGDTVTLRARVAGDGMAGATVSYALNGVGSLGAASGTTDASGETGLFVYNAPSNSGGTAMVTATFGSAQDSVPIEVVAPISVSISPGSATLNPGQTRQFTATVTGHPNTAVQWSATGGTVSQSGLYTAGSAPGTFAVTATSVADPTKSASASVTVGPAGQVTFLSSDAAASGGGFFASGDPNEVPVSNGSGDLGDPDAHSDSGSGSGSVAGVCHPGLGGGPASASGSASFSYSATGATNLTRIEVQSVGSADSSSSGCTAGGGGDAHAYVTFQVSGAPVLYSLTVTASGSSSGATGCGHESGGGWLEGPSGLVIRAVSGAGILAPGFYRLKALVTTGSCSPGEGGSFSGNGSAAIDF